MTKQEKTKRKIQSFLTIVGQIEAGIDAIEPYLDNEDFQEYCNDAYSNITYWRVVIKSFKEEGDLDG